MSEPDRTEPLPDSGAVEVPARRDETIAPPAAPGAGDTPATREETSAGAAAAPAGEPGAGSTAAAAPAPKVPPAQASGPAPSPAVAPAPEVRRAQASGPAPAAPAPAARTPEPAAAPRRRPRGWLDALAERPEIAVEIPRRRLAAQSRRAFILYAVGVAAAAVGAWWLLPDRTKVRLLPGPARNWLDTLAARVGLSRQSRERALDRALTFDDDVAEALYSKDRRVRTYDRSQVTRLPNNYDGQTPGPEYLPTWALQLSGLASGRTERLTINELLRRFPLHEEVTRLVCVEGWSAIAWWGGIPFADLLAAYPPEPGARWAAIRSAVNLDGDGQPDPYYVSIDLATARHPQTLFATHQGGQPLTLAHGAPLRLLAPMKLGLKNIKAITEIAYTEKEPPDYWNERGYSRYDGL